MGFQISLITLKFSVFAIFILIRMDFFTSKLAGEGVDLFAPPNQNSARIISALLPLPYLRKPIKSSSHLPALGLGISSSYLMNIF